MTGTTKVFVHGNPEVDAIWGLLTGELARRGVDDVVLLSPPGFGAPTPAGWPADRAAYRGWLVGELERLTAAGATIDLVGHDWGAGHVFGVVADRPDLVRSWAADCAALIHPSYVWHDLAQVWQTPRAGEELVAAMMGGTIADRTAAYAGLGVPPDVASAMAAAADDEMGRCILALYRDAAQPAMQEFGQQFVAGERPPGLVILATEDPYTPAAEGAEMATALGAATLTLDGCGHWWMFQEPGLAADGLVAFWSELDEN